MSLRYFKAGLIVVTALVLTSSGCSSPPWRRSQLASKQEKNAYQELASERIQYDTSPGQSQDYQPQTAYEPAYTPAASRGSTTGGSGSCCH